MYVVQHLTPKVQQLTVHVRHHDRCHGRNGPKRASSKIARSPVGDPFARDISIMFVEDADKTLSFVRIIRVSTQECEGRFVLQLVGWLVDSSSSAPQSLLR